MSRPVSDETPQGVAADPLQGVRQVNVGNTILHQLGGRRFLLMTGASNAFTRADGISFELDHSKHGITHVRITLTPQDEYVMEFLKVRARNVQNVTTREAHCDNLREVFEEVTGLLTRL